MAEMSITHIGDRSPPPRSTFQGRDRGKGKSNSQSAEPLVDEGESETAADEAVDVDDKDTLGQYVDFIA